MVYSSTFVRFPSVREEMQHSFSQLESKEEPPASTISIADARSNPAPNYAAIRDVFKSSFIFHSIIHEQ